MTKIILAALFFCAIPASALCEGAPSEKVGNADAGIAFFIHPTAADLSDLDVRDAQNQPVLRASATQELDALFRENLVHLLVYALPHAVSQRDDWIESISHLLNNLIYSSAKAIFELFQEAIPTSGRRFVHNVHILCITLFPCSALILLSCALRCRPAVSNQLILRC